MAVDCSSPARDAGKFHGFAQRCDVLWREPGQRQTDTLVDKPHGGNHPFHRDWVGLEEKVAVQRLQPCVTGLGSGTVALQHRCAHFLHLARRDVRRHGDDPVTPRKNEFASSRIVAAEQDEILARVASNLCDPSLP